MLIQVKKLCHCCSKPSTTEFETATPVQKDPVVGHHEQLEVSGKDKGHLDKDKTEEEEEVGEMGSSFAESVINICNSILGSGTMSMAYALRESGLCLGIFCLMLVALLTDYSLIILIKAGIASKTSSYQDLMTVAFGYPGFVIISVFQFTYPFIAMISYNIAVGDTVTKVLIRLTNVSSEAFFVQREFVIIVVTALVTLPISSYRNIEKLAKISFASLFITAVMGVCITTRLQFMRAKSHTDANDIDLINVPGFSKSFGVISFAFMTQHNCFLIFASMKYKGVRRWTETTHTSILISFLVLTSFAVIGYLTFGSLTQGDLMNNYCWHDDVMNVCRLLFASTIVLTFPLECFVCREVVHHILTDKLQLVSKGAEKSLLVWVGITAIITVVALLISFTTQCLGIVIALNGLFMAVPLAYILPCLCFCKVMPGSLLSKEKLPTIVLALFGITVMINGVISIALNNEETCQSDVEMSYCRVLPKRNSSGH